MKLLSPLCLIICLALQAQIPEIEHRSGFHWSMQRAHELPYHVNLANSKELTDAERIELIRIVTAEVLPWIDDDVKNSPGQLRKFVRNTRVKLMDLNGDGIPEVLLQPFDYQIGCGATGNCTLWVFQKTENGYKKILDTRGKDGIGGIELITVESSRTNGYLDLIVAAHNSAVEKDIFVYRFSKGKYRDSSCYVASWISDKDPSVALPKPDIFPCQRKP